MNRPRYETATDLDTEWLIGSEFANKFHCEPRKLPEGMRYWADLALFRDDKLIVLAEIKDRPGWKASYGDVFLGLSKVRELMAYTNMGVPSYFVARLDGVIHYVLINEKVARCDITWGGRTDRKDSKDVEPVVHIPYHLLRKL